MGVSQRRQLYLRHLENAGDVLDTPQQSKLEISNPRVVTRPRLVGVVLMITHTSPGDYGFECPECKQSAFWDRVYGLCYHINCTAPWNIPYTARLARLKRLHPEGSPLNAKVRTVMAIASFIVQCIALYYFKRYGIK